MSCGTSLEPVALECHQYANPIYEFTIRDEDREILDITGAEFVFVIKNKKNGTVLKSVEDGDGLTVTDASGGILLVELDSDVTSLTPNLYYWALCRLDVGERDVYREGTFTVKNPAVPIP